MDANGARTCNFGVGTGGFGVGMPEFRLWLLLQAAPGGNPGFFQHLKSEDALYIVLRCCFNLCKLCETPPGLADMLQVLRGHRLQQPIHC